MKKPLIYFVGLSSKPNCEHLAPVTHTGFIIDQIIHNLPPMNVVKTNLVKTPPLDNLGKLRYPSSNEMTLGWNELQNEIDRGMSRFIGGIGAAGLSLLTLTNGCSTGKTQIVFEFLICFISVTVSVSYSFSSSPVVCLCLSQKRRRELH